MLRKPSKILAAFLFAMLAYGASAQETPSENTGPASGTASETTSEKHSKKERHKISFRDSLDGAFDMSDWLITKKGFVPFPIIVTEPALGGFGGGLAPIFISPKPPMEFKGKMVPSMPTITAAFGGYTLNDTWFAGAGRFGEIRKWKVRYKVAAMYANVNMDFYKTFETIGEQKFDFNINAVPVYAYIGKLLPNPRWIIGIDYMFMWAKLRLNGGELPDWVKSKEKESLVSALGLQVDFDSRDNTFTPDRGVKTYLHGRWSDTAFGSDYDYLNLEYAVYPFFNYGGRKQWVTGLRFDAQQVFGTAPFYLKPFVDMRGVAAERYQGNSTLLVEAEQRWDVVRRWSVLAFGGVGKGFDSYKEFGSADWAYGYGIGGRYLIARKLKLRMGIDLAMGPDGFSYYLVFGSSWARQ